MVYLNLWMLLLLMAQWGEYWGSGRLWRGVAMVDGSITASPMCREEEVSGRA